MHDSKILSASIASREAYEKVARHLTPQDLTPHVAQWWRLIQRWYKADSKASAIDLEILKAKGKRELPEKHVDTLIKVLTDLPEAPSPGNVANEVLDLRRYNLELEVAGMIAGREDRHKVQEKITQLQELYRATSLKESKIIVAGGLDELDDLYTRENLIKFAPAILTERTGGGGLRGHHVLVFARPEMGKSLFVVNLAAGFLKQKLKVLYIGNEDPIKELQYRLRSNLANMSRETIEKYGERGTAEANRRARKYGMDDRAIMVHLHPGSIAEMDELLDEHRPDVLMIDQIRNIGGGTELTARLNQVAIEVRSLLGRYNVLGVSTTQANAPENGSPKIWLRDGDVDSSKTGLPAQVDLMLGIGADEGMLARDERAISLVKNKLSGNHEGFLVHFDRFRSKVK